MAGEYPRREQFFAHKFVRLLHKAAVASEIGRDAVCLLVFVAHTEDAMRYRGAAKFWNSQLVETLGFSKWEQFDNARQKAMSAGWLHYSCHGKRQAGEYYVLVPDGYEVVTDTPIECTSVNPENGYKEGYDAGYKAGYEQGYKQGEPSSPVPSPFPKYSPGGEIQIPEKMNIPSVIAAVGDWFRHLENKGKSEKIPLLNSPQEQAFWSLISRMGADGFLTAVEKAMAEGWVTLRPASTNGTQNGSHEGSSDWIETLKAARAHPDDWKKRKSVLGPERFEALKLTGSARVANANDYELKTLKEIYESHLKDIRSGITASN